MVDLLARDSAGAMWALPGTGRRRLRDRRPGGRVLEAVGHASPAPATSPATVAPTWSSAPSPGRRPGSCPPAATSPSASRSGRSTASSRRARSSGAAQYAADGLPDVVSRRGRRRTHLPQPRHRRPAAADQHRRDPEGRQRRPQRRRLGPRRRRRHDLPHRQGCAVPAHRRRHRAASATGRRSASGFGKVRLLAAVGDMTGDGWPDLMGQPRRLLDADLPGRRPRRARGRATSPTARSTPPGRSPSAAGTPTAPPTASSAPAARCRSTRATAPAG